MPTLTFKYLSPEKLEENYFPFDSLDKVKHKNRLEQIGLIKAIITDVKASTLSADEKSKIITGAYLYIKNRIDDSYDPYKKVPLIRIFVNAKNSDVHEMVNTAIGVTEKNPLDKVSQNESLLAFRNYVFANKHILDKLNLTIKAAEIAEHVNKYVSPNLNTELPNIKLAKKDIHSIPGTPAFIESKLHKAYVDDRSKSSRPKNSENTTVTEVATEHKTLKKPMFYYESKNGPYWKDVIHSSSVAVKESDVIKHPKLKHVEYKEKHAKLVSKDHEDVTLLLTDPTMNARYRSYMAASAESKNKIFQEFLAQKDHQINAKHKPKFDVKFDQPEVLAHYQEYISGGDTKGVAAKEIDKVRGVNRDNIYGNFFAPPVSRPKSKAVAAAEAHIQSVIDSLIEPVKQANTEESHPVRRHTRSKATQ